MTTMTAQPTTDLDGRTDRRLRAAGIAVLVAAALGSVLGASPVVAETTSTDRDCRMDIVGSYWFSSGCSEQPAATTAR
jgi:hypothetical protein